MRCVFCKLESEFLYTRNSEEYSNLTFRGPCIVIYYYKKNQRHSLISQIYFLNRTPHVSDRFSFHHQESSTVYTAIGICRTGYADCLLAGSGCSMFLLLCMQYQTPDDGQKTCPKRVDFYSKNEFEKLVHLVGFIVRKNSNSLN